MDKLLINLHGLISKRKLERALTCACPYCHNSSLTESMNETEREIGSWSVFCVHEVDASGCGECAEVLFNAEAQCDSNLG